MANIWFTSDTHFGHGAIIRHCGRTFADAREMDEALIAGWNACVRRDDEVYHLGDFACSGAEKSGNHEFYGGKIYKVLRELRAALAGTRVHLLDRDEIVLSNDGLALRFLGTTLWTDFALNAGGTGIDGAAERDIELAMDIAGNRRNDFKRITVGPEDIGRPVYRRLIPRDTLGFHVRDRRWLRDRLAEPFDGRTVVVTHMAPSARSVPEPVRGDWIGAGDASNLEDLIEEMKPDLWVHGHTHTSSNYAIGSTRVVSNPFGYWGHELNPDFAVDRVVDLAAAPAPKMEI